MTSTSFGSVHSPPSTSKNSLIYEVHENFDFEQNEINATSLNVAGGGGSSLTSSLQRRNQYSMSNPLLRVTDNLNDLSPSSYFFNQNFDENGYVFDGIKIEIEDVDNTSVSNATTQSLKRCKNQVLKHYYNLLCFIGWRPFYKDNYYRMPIFCKLINFIYPILIILLLFYEYSYDMITCSSKLNPVLDTVYIPPITLQPAYVRNTTKIPNLKLDNVSTTIPTIIYTIYNYIKGQKTLNETNTSILVTSSRANKIADEESTKKEQICGHVFTTYIVPSIMHLASYIIGFIYFRINENEQLYALMEKVFLAVNKTLKMVSQDRVIKRLKVFIILGVFWVILAMSMHILSRLAFDEKDTKNEKDIFKPYWVFVSIQGVALVIMNSIYLAVVINYATQCEMIVFYVNEIRTRLEEKSVTLKDAMQQILDVRMAIGSLNSTVSKMTTLVALTFVEKFIIGLIILLMNQVQDVYAWVYRSLFTISWFLILAFTITQVARLNSKCSKFKQIALSARIYGYHNCSRDELDSFLLFIANAKLRAKLFGVPLKPSYILGTCILILFTLIILFQTSVITPADSFF